MEKNTPTPDDEGYGYAWYMTIVLMIAYTLSFLDRQILVLMVGPIERDLGITDSQFALLTGAAFGIFYTIMGLPLGWMADRYNRTKIVASGIAVWSLMTAFCGLAQNYTQLFLARVGVGVGEATLSPAAYSMLGDSFDKKRLPRAMSIYTCGIFIGVGLAMIIGSQIVGALDQYAEITVPILGTIKSWHAVFLVVGLPGVLLSLWILSLREPMRKVNQAQSDIETADKVGITEVFHFVGRYKWMSLSLFIGSALYSVLAYTDAWYPELFIRTWGWKVEQAGQVNGLASLTAGPLGLLFAGWYSGKLIEGGKVDGCLRLTAFGAAGICVFEILMPLMPTPFLMSALLFPIKFFVGFTPVLVPAAIQIISPGHLRAQLGALFLFCVGIIGISLGPILPAALNDYLFVGVDNLPQSLALSSLIIGPFAVVVLWVGLAQYRDRYNELTDKQG